MELIFEISSPAALSEFVKMLLKTLLTVFRYYSQKNKNKKEKAEKKYISLSKEMREKNKILL